MKPRVFRYLNSLVFLLLLGVAIGCSKAPNDAQITSDIQSKISTDSGLQGKQLGVQAENGTVTLSGAVDNDAEREAAARYAASVPGVKQVINNLTTTPPPAPAPVAEQTPPPAPAPAPEEKPAPAPKPRA
ncbi:MAG TPA: BON domain-containing protein, partial [Terriglobales bacterium]|nr:BON domain-containing protein [Terriglobales bacterium]